MLFSCKKTDISLDLNQKAKNSAVVDPVKTTKFLSSTSSHYLVKKVIDLIQSKNDKKEFLTAFIDKNGYAFWDKSQIFTLTKSRTSFSSNNSLNALDTIILIPLVLEDQIRVNGFIKVVMNDSVKMSYSLASDYKNYPIDRTETNFSAESFASLIMTMDKIVFNYTKFSITDSSLFRDNTVNSAYEISVKLTDTTGPSNISNNNNNVVAITQCTNTYVFIQQPCDFGLQSANAVPVCGIEIQYNNCYIMGLEWDSEGSGYPSGGIPTSGGGGDSGPIPHDFPCNPNIVSSNVMPGQPLPPCNTPPSGTVGWNPAPIDYIDENAGDPPIDLQKFMNCFSLVPDAGATYSIKLCSDLPVNYFPNIPFNINLSPGHTFITLTKTNGTESVTQSVGFYPNTMSASAPGGFRDNGIIGDGHEYNAAITINTASAGNFNTVIQSLLSHQNDQYEITTNNCTTVALEAFNSIISPPIQVDVFQLLVPSTPTTSISILQSPQELFKSIGRFQPSTQITKQYRVNQQAPDSHGPCN